MPTIAPPIYAPQKPVARLRISERILAGFVAAACLSVLCIAARLTPDPSGLGTHQELRMARCDFYVRTGVPCPSCGMTTSFAHFAHGNFLASVWVQPMGAALALLTAATFWISFYIAATGINALRMIQIIPQRYFFYPLVALAIAAWGWKIFIHLHGMDGW